MLGIHFNSMFFCDDVSIHAHNSFMLKKFGAEKPPGESVKIIQISSFKKEKKVNDNLS